MNTAEQPNQSQNRARVATIYRMVMPSHTCPYGIKAVDLLIRKGFKIDDRHLETQDATDAFRAEHGVRTTPQIWVDDQRIGGYDDLRAHLGQVVRPEGETTYRPVAAIFSIAALMALAFSWYATSSLLSMQTIEWFIGVSMCFLAVQKLQDVERFSTMFLNYDLLAQRWVRYGYLYPYGEALAGISMLSGALVWIAAPIALFIGSIGAISVVKAVYIDKRSLKCACVGGSSNVPLGFVSLTENIMMVLMGSWMLTSALFEIGIIR